MGGDCKFTNNLSEKFAWGLRIPGLDHSVRCKYCNTVVKIARGLFALKQHEQSAMHKKNMPSTSSRTPNIAAALYTSCSKETGVLRATIYHCLKIIVDDASFRSSECFSRNRSLYKVMFPDSSFAAINCGKTKTGYIITRAIAPFVRDQVTDKITSCDRVGIHMDESSYHKKCRLEFWIVHFDGELRKNSYLRTIELEAKFSVDEFLNDSVKKLSDVEFVGSSAVFDAFCTVLAEFKLNYEQIAYVMTDNCNTMRGERSGAVKKIASSKYKEECEVLKARNQRVESQATVFRDEFDIYKRRTPCELKRELKSVDSEIERTQALLEELHSKKSRLSSETASANFLADSQSSDVIAKMFKNLNNLMLCFYKISFL